MSNKKTIVLGLDYTEFSGGIADINRKMGLLDQEFKLAAEMAKRYGEETDHLTAKQDQLTQKITLQNQKVEAAKKAYDAVMASQDNQGKKADALDKALLKERTTLEKLNNELASNKEKLDQLVLSEADRKMATLENEFNLATEKAKKFGDETEQLTLKQSLLIGKLETQAQKVEATKNAYDDAVKSGDKSEKQLSDLYNAYLENEIALEKLNNELADNTTKMNNSDEKTKSFGDTIRGLASSIGIDINPAVEALASKFDGISEKAGMAILTIGTMITTLGRFTLSTAEAAGKIDELSHKTGLTTDTIQELNYAAEFLEVSAEDIGSSIAKMTKSMDTARSGTGDAAEAFRTLKVRIDESNGQLRDSEAVFYDVIDALGKHKNETEKDALSMSIFGKSAMSLNNLILEGSKGIKGYAKEAREAGYIIDNETIQAFNNMDDAMVRMNKKFDAVKMKLGEALLPVFEKFADLIGGMSPEVLMAGIILGGLGIVLVSVASAASKMAIANAMLSTTNTTVGATGLVASIGMGPLLLILLAVAVAIGLIVGRAAGIKEAMNSVKDSVTDLIDTSNKALNGANDAANSVNYVKKKSETYGNTYFAPDYSHSSGGRNFASGTDNFPGGDTWINDGGKPELVRLPGGSKIYSGDDTESILGGNTYINVTVNAKDFDEMNKVINLFKNIKQTGRQGVIKLG
jgi:hypothetical protein